jgi:hypothetical protein
MTPSYSADLEILQLRMEMLERGLKVHELARMAGVKPRRLANVCCGQDKTWPIRHKLNLALGHALFSKPRRAHGSASVPKTMSPRPASTLIGASGPQQATEPFRARRSAAGLPPTPHSTEAHSRP